MYGMFKHVWDTPGWESKKMLGKSLALPKILLEVP